MTFEQKLDAYEALLRKWQKTINLVAPETLDELRLRHFDDSLQLAGLIPGGAKILFDLGSGAGFPGMVLAIARPDLDVHLVESDARKGAFLNAVSRETRTAAKVHTVRAEHLPLEALPMPDVITARALAPLRHLLGYILPWAQRNPALVVLLPKGENAEAELAEARKKYHFTLKTHPSQTASNSVILEITDLCIT